MTHTRRSRRRSPAKIGRHGPPPTRSVSFLATCCCSDCAAWSCTRTAWETVYLRRPHDHRLEYEHPSAVAARVPVVAACRDSGGGATRRQPDVRVELRRRWARRPRVSRLQRRAASFVCAAGLCRTASHVAITKPAALGPSLGRRVSPSICGDLGGPRRNTEAVTYVTQRTELLAGVFYLLTPVLRDQSVGLSRAQALGRCVDRGMCAGDGQQGGDGDGPGGGRAVRRCLLG